MHSCTQSWWALVVCVAMAAGQRWETPNPFSCAGLRISVNLKPWSVSQPPSLPGRSVKVPKEPESSLHLAWMAQGPNKASELWGSQRLRGNWCFGRHRFVRRGVRRREESGAGTWGAPSALKAVIGLGWPKRFVDWDNKSVVCFLACWGGDYKLSHKGMQIASQTLQEACGVASYLEHLCGSLLLPSRYFMFFY